MLLHYYTAGVADSVRKQTQSRGSTEFDYSGGLIITFTRLARLATSGCAGVNAWNKLSQLSRLRSGYMRLERILISVFNNGQQACQKMLEEDIMVYND